MSRCASSRLANVEPDEFARVLAVDHHDDASVGPGFTPLALAAYNNHVSCAALLLSLDPVAAGLRVVNGGLGKAMISG